MSDLGLEAPVRVAILIPALDEEEALSLLLPSLAPALHGVDPALSPEVVVVDNGSTDATAAVARSFGADVVFEDERGYGAACLAGLDHLRSSGAPPQWVVFVDADHGPLGDDLAHLLAPLKGGDAELVLGVRQGGPGNRRPLHARHGTRFILGLARLLGGGAYDDLPPFRAITWGGLERLAMDDRTWGWTLQMQLRAHRSGMVVREVGLPYRSRPLGRSKISGSLRTSLAVGSVMLRTLLLDHRRYRRGGRPGSPG